MDPFLTETYPDSPNPQMQFSLCGINPNHVQRMRDKKTYLNFGAVSKKETQQRPHRKEIVD
jgi:hypothetical protein